MNKASITYRAFTPFWVLVILLSLGGCDYMSKFTDFASQEFGEEDIPEKRIVKSKSQKELDRIHTIYIQNLSGENVKTVQKALFQEIDSENRFILVDILPRSTQGLGILRMRVEDYALWETMEEMAIDPKEGKALQVKKMRPKFTKEQLEKLEDLPLPGAKIPESLLKSKKDKKKKAPQVLRRNALIRVSFALFSAKTGRPLIQERFSQPFQQIYVNREMIESRPKAKKELERLNASLVKKIAIALEGKPLKKDLEDLEGGESFGWFAEEVHNQGDFRLAKGNRLAQASDLEQAMWVWQLVIFSPDPDEPPHIYLQNRASAFYNLGRAYDFKGDPLNAARMYSQANRLIQTQKYAESWGESMNSWLEMPEGGYADLKEEEVKIIKLEPKKRKGNLDLLKDIETNPTLLLRPKKLWPLEQKITGLKDDQLNGPLEINVDKIHEEQLEKEMNQEEEPLIPIQKQKTGEEKPPVTPFESSLIQPVTP